MSAELEAENARLRETNDKLTTALGKANTRFVLAAEKAETRKAAADRVTVSSDYLEDSADVAAEGRKLEAEGTRYLVENMIPDYGTLGFSIAYAKVGKTTWGQQLGGAVAREDIEEFCGFQITRSVRVLYVAAEDPPEYTAWLARHLDIPRGRMTFYRRPILLDAGGLKTLGEIVAGEGFGFVLIASWQAVIRGLIKDENDNAGAVMVCEEVKAATREWKVPVLIDAHSGKGEDQGDDADPVRALRGASAAAGSADYLLSLRYGNGAFGTRRRLAGKGRFCNVPTQLLDYDPTTGAYRSFGAVDRAGAEEAWKLIASSGALDLVPRTADEIARASGLHVEQKDAKGRKKKVTGSARRKVVDALRNRPGITVTIEPQTNGRPMTRYSRAGTEWTTVAPHGQGAQS